MESAVFNIHNLVRMDFHTDEKSFYDFVCGNYRIFTSEPAEPQKKLRVRVLFHEDPNLPHVLANKVGRNLYVEDNKILSATSSYRICLTESTDRLEIVTFVQSTEAQKSLKESLKNLLKPGRRQRIERKRSEQRYRNYVIIMRQSIHMPLFYVLETMGFMLLHGAAVAKNDCCYLFLGLGGIGKTTVALNLVTTEGFKFLTDDYILIRDNILYSFAEKVRLAQDTLNALGLKKEGVKIVSKYHISLPMDKIQKRAVPTKIFFVFNSSEPRIESIDTLKALRQINGMHNYLAEFPEHFYLTFLPHFPQRSEMQNRYHQFLQNTEAYNLYLSSNHDENTELLLHLEEVE